MPNPVNTDDLERRWRPLSAQETTNAVELLGDAWAELRRRVPMLEDRLASAELDTALVVKVVRAMVLRVLQNPEGYQSETIGEYGYTRGANAGEVSATSDELELLWPVTAAHAGVGMINLRSPYGGVQ